MVLFVEARVAALHGDRFPDPFGLIGLHAGASDCGRKQAARRQRQVAHHLGVHAEARPARKEPVLGIDLELVFTDPGGLPVRRRRHHQADQLFDVPAGLAEFHGQPVEQLRVRRRLALRSEIFRRLHQAGSENLLPEAIDRDARGQRIGRIDNPLSVRCRHRVRGV